MADQGKFSESGLKLIGTVAAFAAAAPVIGPAAIIAAAGFVVFFSNLMANDTTVADALKSLKKQVEEIKAAILELDRRIDELVVEFAVDSNRQTLRDLHDQMDNIQIQVNRLHDRPDDLNTAVDAANELGVIIDKFLRSDFEIWRWTDVVEKNGGPDAEIGRFKNVPTLPVYLVGVLAWLGAREGVVQANQRERLSDDAARLSRHLNAVSFRNDFDKYRSDHAGTPTTIAENIKSRIRAFPVASNKFPENRVCHFFYDIHNYMNGDHTRGDNFDIIAESNDVLCTVDPFSLGMPNTEIDWEINSGVDILRELASLLARVEATGSMREQLIERFPTGEVYPPSIIYIIAQNGDLQWYRNEASSQPGGSNKWLGPTTIGTSWQGFTTVFNGGGHAIYGIQPDGTLLWYGHAGFMDGSNNWLNNGQPKQVGTGWNGFKFVFPGGEFVIYGVQQDGTLLWYRHHGGLFGGEAASHWSGPLQVATGWGHFEQVFSAGEGVIYAIDANATLFRAVHKGYRTGAPEWETDTAQPIAEGMGFFSHSIAGADQVIYGFRRDGRVFYTRYAERRHDASEGQSGGGLGGILNPTPIFVPGLPPALSWEGPPVEIKHNMPGFLSVFPKMDEPDTGVS